MVHVRDEASKPLNRDNTRFNFLFPNGKPKLPSGFKATLPVTTTYQVAKESDKK